MKLQIYAISDPRTKQIRYVGCSQDARRRLSVHMARIETDADARSMWLGELRDLELRPNLVILQEVEDGSVHDSEREWISTLRSRGADLFNTTHNNRRYGRHKGEIHGPVNDRGNLARSD